MPVERSSDRSIRSLLVMLVMRDMRVTRITRIEHFGRPSQLVRLAGLAIALATLGCGALASEPVRDARLACERKKEGPSCFLAGSLVAEKSGTNGEAVRLFTRGCSVRHSPSCEALANVKGPLREQALVDACNGGDLVSCSRRAAEFGTDARGLSEARALRHNVCKLSAGLKRGMSAREIEGIAEACAALARMIATGEGGGRDAVAAARLDVLATTLRNEALYQHEREDDGKRLPPPAQAPEVVDRRSTKGLWSGPKPDPTLPERTKFRRDYEAKRAARDAWMASVEASFAGSDGTAKRGDPSAPTPSPYERVTPAAGAVPTVASTCQTCVEACGLPTRCSGDDFVGGPCGHLRCEDPSSCAPFDECVSKCASKAEECTKSCGDCTTAAPASAGAKRP